jgi:hypothetical protein
MPRLAACLGGTLDQEASRRVSTRHARVRTGLRTNCLVDNVAYALSRNHSVASGSLGWGLNNFEAEFPCTLNEEPDLLLVISGFVVFRAFIDILLALLE